VSARTLPRRQSDFFARFSSLTGKDQNPKFARLSAEDSQSIREIVRDTKTNLPQYWE